jgi:hypothetical protein
VAALAQSWREGGRAAVRTIFETCVPREDVLSGDLPEHQFAAKLYAVARQDPQAPAVYRETRAFFTYTYPTQGLRSLMREVFGRFRGAPGSSPTLRLETSFGGGKTHNMIALWHAARHAREAAAAAGSWLDPALLPAEPIHVVALVGDQYGGGEVDRHDGVLTRTLWGELAWQLGAYDVLREADTQRQAPSRAALEEVLGGRPVLVLLDELPHYLRMAKGQRVGRGTLADQTLGFFRLLLEYAAGHDHLVVVYSLSERQDAFARERDEIVEQIGEARSLSARQERVVTPIAEGEIAAVLRRRLFLAVDAAAAPEVAEGYVEHLRRSRAQGAPLPSEVEEPSFRQRLEASYPFHPELLATLYRKACSFPTFQWARGALRLLAATVRWLWQVRPKDAYLVHSTDLDLSHPAVQQELTARLDRPRLRSAIAEDIWSEHGNAHAQRFDEEWAAKGYLHLCRRAAQAVFLHSLVYGAARKAAGADPAEAHLACGRPGLPFDVVDRVLSQIDEKFWYAEFDGQRYVFHDDPTVKKLIEEAAGAVSHLTAKEDVRHKAQEVFGAGGLFDLVPFPAGPEEVPDRGGRPLLVLLDPDHVALEGGSEQVPAVVEDIFYRAGQDRDFRNYQNNLVVLVADAGKRDGAAALAQKVRGIKNLLDSPEQVRRLGQEGERKLREAQGAADLDFRVAVTNLYCHLFYRPMDEGAAVAHHELPAQESAQVRRQQQTVLRDALAQLGKVLADRDLSPEWVRERIWNDAVGEITLHELADRFRRRPRAYLLFDEGLSILRRTVVRGVAEGLWVFFDERTGEVYRKGRALAAEQVRLEKDAWLLTPARAEERVPSPGPSTEGARRPEGIAAGPTPTGTAAAPAGAAETEAAPYAGERGWRAEASGPPTKAFAELRDRLAEAGDTHLEELLLEVADIQDTRRLLDGWSAVTNALAGARVTVTHALQARGADGEPLSLTFQGPDRQFARLQGWIRGVLEQLAAQRREGQLEEPFLQTRVTARFPQPVDAADARWTELAWQLAETYRCGKVGVKAR